MNFNPVQDRLLVKLVEEDNQTSSGFYIPSADQSQPHRAKVLAVGEGRKTAQGVVVPMDIKVDDTVLFIRGLGQKITITGEDYVILKEDEVLGTLE